MRAKFVFISAVLGLLVAAAPAAAKSRPNLEVTKLSQPPAHAAQGTALQMKDTVKNTGDAKAKPSTTRFYLSSDRKKSKGDNALSGGQSVGSLKPGETAKGHAGYAIGDGVADGRYYVIACADAKRKVDESNEKDNCRSSKTRVHVAPVAATPYEINQGQIAPGTHVSIAEITVTAVRSDGEFWVQAGGVLENSALEVTSEVTPNDLARGDVVQLVGIAHVPGLGSPGLTATSITKTGVGATPVATVLSDSQIANPPAPLNGVLVDARNQTIASEAGGDWTMDSGLVIAHDIIGTLPSYLAGREIVSVIGIADTFGSAFRVSPRGDGDIVAGPAGP